MRTLPFDYRRIAERGDEPKPEEIRTSLEKIQPEVTTTLEFKVSMIDLMRSQDLKWGIPDEKSGS